MSANGKKQPVLIVLALAIVCVVTAMTLVYTKHESRKALTDQRDALNIEWGQLQIEQSTWATHARIEQVATEDLELLRPEATEIFVIEKQ